MFINSILFIGTFFLLGRLLIKDYLFLEKVLFGIIVLYFILIITTLLNVDYEDFVLIIKILCILSFLHYLIENFSKIKMQGIKKKIKLSNILTIFFFTLIIFENYLNILSKSLSAGDSLAYWFNKTKFFIYNPGIEFFPKVDYPNLLSSFWSFSFYNFDKNYNHSRIILPLVIFSCILLIFQKIKLSYNQHNNSQINILFLIILIYFSTVVFAGMYRFSNAGYSDGLLSIFLMVGFFYIYKSIMISDYFKKEYFFGIVILAISSSIKNEGFVISIMVFVILNSFFVIFFKKKFFKNIKFLILNFVIFLLVSVIPIIITIYLNTKQMIVSSNIKDFLNVLNLIDFEIHSQRLYPIIKFFFHNVYYNLEILLPLLIIILSKFSLALVKSKEFLLFFIFSTFFIFYIYILYISTAFPFDWHLATSFDRIFFHFMGIFSIFLYIFYFYENKDKKNLKISSLQ